MADLAVLRTAKQAMDEGLITDYDYQLIKQAFTKAQMIKAGLDAGFIKDEDYMQARNTFLQSLDLGVSDQPPMAMPVQAAPMPRAMPPAPALAANGSSNGAAPAPPRAAASPRGPPPPAAPPPPPQLARPPPPAAAAPSRGATAGGANAYGSSTSGTIPGTAPIPKDIGRIGRTGTAEGKKSMSGIGLDDSCINLFNYIKTKSVYKWVTFKIDDSGTMVVVDQLGAPDCTYEQFLAILPENQCRYAVYDYGYSNNDTGFVTQKLVFIHWSPGSSSIKAKMMYSSTKDFIKGFLDGVGAELQADSVDDLTEEEIQNRIAGGMTRK